MWKCKGFYSWRSKWGSRRIQCFPVYRRELWICKVSGEAMAEPQGVVLERAAFSSLCVTKTLPLAPWWKARAAPGRGGCRTTTGNWQWCRASVPGLENNRSTCVEQRGQRFRGSQQGGNSYRPMDGPERVESSIQSRNLWRNRGHVKVHLPLLVTRRL